MCDYKIPWNLTLCTVPDTWQVFIFFYYLELYFLCRHFTLNYFKYKTFSEYLLLKFVVLGGGSYLSSQHAING